MRYQTDVAIIGAGPVGLFAVFQCGMLGLKCQVIDALDMIGGQCTALYPEKPIYDIPAHPQISGEDLIRHLQRQIAPFHPEIHLNQQVTHLEKQKEGTWLLKTSRKVEIVAKSVIIAAGAGAFGPNRPPLPGIETYEGQSVFYMVKAREDFRGKKIVIAGGGDSAVDWAISLAELAEKIYVVHRRDKFRAAPDSLQKMNALNGRGVLEIVTPYQLHGLEGEEGILTAVHLKTLEGESRRLEADCLLAFFGLSMDLGPIAEWGLDLEKKTIKVDPTTAETSVPGIFAVGDVSTYPNKLKLILCGFSEAALAAHRIRALIYPDQVFHFEYSTTRGVPGASQAA